MAEPDIWYNPFKQLRTGRVAYVLFGYRVGEIVVKLKPVCDDATYKLKKTNPLKAKKNRKGQQFTGPIMLLSALDCKPAYAPPTPDKDYPENEVAASRSRFCTQMPGGDPHRKAHFVSFAKTFIRLHWTETLRSEDVPTLSKFLKELANYPGGRKSALLSLRTQIWRTENKGKRATTSSKGFIKDEFYMEYKAPRAINSYTDESKTILAPLCHAIDKKTFKSRFFVKGSNPKEWPRRLEEVFGGSPVLGTDFTSFESHHFGAFSEAVTYWILHMCRTIPHCKPLKDLVCLMMNMRNKCSFKHTTVEVDQRLMSGALWTSSANGMLNLLINAYLAADATGRRDVVDMAGWANTQLRAVFEGDDGLAADIGQSEMTINELGLRLKFEKQANYAEAGFCGIVCERGRDGVLKDPTDVLSKFFWLPARYHSWPERSKKCLMRAKALSYKYTFGNTPIVGAMCDWVLRQTANHVANYQAVQDGYHNTVCSKTLDNIWRTRTEVSVESRVLVEKRFGIPHQAQRILEQIFENSRQDHCYIPTDFAGTLAMARNREIYCLPLGQEFKPPTAQGEALEQLLECNPLRESCQPSPLQRVKYPNTVLEPFFKWCSDSPWSYC